MIEIRSVGSLLGVASDRLKQGLTLKTKNVRGQIVQSLCSVDEVGFEKIFSCIGLEDGLCT